MKDNDDSGMSEQWKYWSLKKNPDLIDRKVIEDIKAEIENISDKAYITFEGTTHGERLKTSRECKEEVIEIIDKHMKQGGTDDSN